VKRGSPVEILPFRDEFAPDFDRLNRDWLTRYFSVEPLDEVYLSNPRAAVLDKGGEIFFARLEGQVVGTCAAVPEGGGVFELAKLAVDPAIQGRGIGRRLVEEVLAYVRASGGHRVLLWSASKLAPAVRLYESMGFVHAVFPGAPPYDDPQVDVYMELRLEPPDPAD
jgi:GNAT superfamily N-acetyltransferase